MRRFCYTLFLTLIVGLAFAQQRPQYSQYIFNNYLVNPAISGIESYIDVKASHRNQWTGLEGKPVTNYLSVQAPLGQRFLRDNGNFFGGYNNQSHRDYVDSYSAAAPHHGVGMHLVSDKLGLMNRIDINGTYAYHIGLTGKVNLAVGAAIGLTSLSVDFSKISLDNSADPAIAASTSPQLKPDLGLGLWLYGPQYFVGVSAQQLFGQTLTFPENETFKHAKLVPHFFLTAGYKIFLGADLAAIPSVMIKRVSPAPNSYDANLKLAFRDRFWMGGSYRSTDSFSAMAGFNISHLFNLGYSYDFTTSSLKNVSEGSHEIVLGLLLNNRYKVTCPQRYW